MFDNRDRSLIVAGSIEEALAAVGQGAKILAGGTWLMRDPRRGRPLPSALVSLHKLAGFNTVDIEADRIVIGAAVSHQELGRSLAGFAGLEAVAAAAASAANPAVRRVATIGGNLCTQDFSAADLVPALLAVEATVELQGVDGTLVIPFFSFLADRKRLLTDMMLSKVFLRRDILASAHARLPLRRAGDYPVAIVSLALCADGKICAAVGSVEDVGRRWTALEKAFAAQPGGRPADAKSAEALAVESNDFKGRDGIEADGWYRRQVLPALVRRSMSVLLNREVGR
ncbi:FAD binding domain-containing protein [Allorhizobium taibaishanense]|uniref:Carbon-monoxide dehydrogenase medium subunit n=1 Tax=Allorhizobium taibaishanense TaxID=887144 RepID=A0A1Q9AA50_9HYPH|nr:FAD binding domain-containing protein [Allorhizobium taibaishanense]MBB4010085.1 carbon-monoxide dehydrogenase medium subunit [Allorhizobium taibaishanense]OLP51688.1 molybdopterin dehydrogenase [Allorhizobium taibaishanense]